MYVEYDSNNSGGSWWLKDKDWKKLEKAGWKVQWVTLEHAYTEEGEHVLDVDGMPKLEPYDPRKHKYHFNDSCGDRWLGALARRAYRAGLSLVDAIAEWEKITGQDASDEGCNCCGQPHSFTAYDSEGKYLASPRIEKTTRLVY